MARARIKAGRTARERAMIVDYWRRVWRGDKDPYRGTLRRFKLRGRKAHLFFIDHNIDDMSPTKH